MNFNRLIPLFFFICTTIFCQGQDSLWTRPYNLEIYNQNDLRNSAHNGLTIHKALHDGFRKGLKPSLGKAGNISYGLYSFATTYLTMIWSHEIGHSLRADQVGGHFKIHNGDLPIPYTTMHLPSDISYVDEALSVTGGFEVNHLTVRAIQRNFIRENGTYNEDLAYSFANRMMYTIYTSIIVPVNPNDKDIWINTAGDPVHCVLPVFKNYSNDKVFMPDSSVNPELVRFYNQSSRFGVLWQLLDPHFYKEFGASFGKPSKERRPFFILGTHETGWTYGTMFNVSPLGYELYMNNYIHINGNQFEFYGRYGRPFKNTGIGLNWNNIIDSDKLLIGASLELWDQDIFGAGGLIESQMMYKLNKSLAINFNTGYKSEGYVLGKQLQSGFNAGFGITYFAKY